VGVLVALNVAVGGRDVEVGRGVPGMGVFVAVGVWVGKDEVAVAVGVAVTVPKSAEIE